MAPAAVVYTPILPPAPPVRLPPETCRIRLTRAIPTFAGIWKPGTEMLATIYASGLVAARLERHPHLGINGLQAGTWERTGDVMAAAQVECAAVEIELDELLAGLEIEL